MEARWHSSISEISGKAWSLIFGKNVVKSYEFFLSMETSRIRNASFLYLTVQNSEETLAIVPCFTYRLMFDVLAPDIIKKTTKIIRSLFPRFLCMKIFGVGSLASTCQHHIGIRSNLTNSEFLEIGNIITEQVILKSKQLAHQLILIKEVPDFELKWVKEIFSKRYYFYDSLPNTFIPTNRSIAPYPSKLKGKERYRCRKLKQQFEREYYWELINDFEADIDKFEHLYSETLKKSKNKFEVLNKEFFQAINKILGSKSFLLIAKNKNNHQYESAGIVLDDDKALIPLYIGINYLNEPRKLKLLHSNSIIRVIEEAEKRGKFHVILGQTSYYPKVLSGALVERLYLGFYSYNCIIQFIVHNLLQKVFPKTKVLPNVYKKDYETQIKRDYMLRGVNISN